MRKKDKLNFIKQIVKECDKQQLDTTNKLEIVGLYEHNDVYQVVDSTNSVLFQGSKVDCKKYIKRNK